MNARDEVLQRVRSAIVDIPALPAEEDVPLDWTFGGGIAMDDVVATFQEKVEDYQAVVVRADQAGLTAAVVDGLHATEASGQVVVPPGLDAALVSAIGDAGFDVLVDSPDVTSADLDQVSAVVTASAVSIADTGTIVLDHGPDQGRRALSLVPDRHVCIVREDQIVSDVPEAITRLHDSAFARSPITFISGGSATSDIELSRVDGVHGPRKLHVVVVR